MLNSNIYIRTQSNRAIEQAEHGPAQLWNVVHILNMFICHVMYSNTDGHAAISAHLTQKVH